MTSYYAAVDELKEYTGKYKADNFKSEIIIRDGELIVINNDIPDGVKIHAINKTEFSFQEKYLDFHFNRNSEGKVISFLSY